MKQQRFVMLCSLVFLITVSASIIPRTIAQNLDSGTNTQYMPLVEINVSIGQFLTPFDTNTEDVVGPSDWHTRYGKSPEIIVASNGQAIDVLAQDYNPQTPWQAVLFHIEKRAGAYRIIQAQTSLPMLDRIMGLAVDSDGNRYYATGVDEDKRISSSNPPPNTSRTNIVRLIKLDPAGKVLFNIDVDPARHAFDPSAEMIINPMTASTSRLAVSGNEIALVHGINTNPDSNKVRHQKALSTRFDATTGEVTQVASAWVSHSFDQRLLVSNGEIVGAHLGDAYPRFVVLDRNRTAFPLFYIKGALGENNTFTRLGGLAPIENDPTYRYLALFATESTATVADTLGGPRNLAIVRVKNADTSVDATLPDSLTVTSVGKQQTNHLRWLTRYSANSNMHAERPKLVAIGNNRYSVIWEAWNSTADTNSFDGVYAMIIDDKGNIIRDAKKLTGDHHLQRGDDALLLDSRAAWITGDAKGKKLYLHMVDAALNYEMITLG